MSKSEIHSIVSIICLLVSCFIITPVLAHGSNFFITKEHRNIELRNNIASIVISEKAELVECVDLKTNKNIAENNHKKIVHVKTSRGEIIEASNVCFNGDILTFTIGEWLLNVETHTYQDYFTFEVINDTLPKEVDELCFINLKLEYDYSLQNVFLAAGVAMSLQTDPCFYPTGANKEVKGRCMSQTGIKGAKMAVVACEKADLRRILKEIYLSIPNGDVPISLVGGPFALDFRGNASDCLMLNDADPQKIDEWINYYSKLGIGQFNFELGNNTFIQGQFSFPKFGSAEEFKRQIVEPLKEAGINSTLHTYSYYISYQADEILSNPKWQQQLEFRESFVLSKEISEADKEINIIGDKTGLLNDPPYWKVHSPYLLIDEEIIKYYLGGDGLVLIQRGQCGTKAVSHQVGAVVKLIGGYYSHIAPQPGSELFYEIAHRTAAAYNEGGFNGIYFDAIDGLGIHLTQAKLDGYIWYYGAKFINEVLKYCIVPPTVECATLYPSIWSARDRGGAWDTPYRGYKRFIDEHISVNKSPQNSYYHTTLGWYNFYPLSSGIPQGFSTDYMFFDDVDYLGVKSIAFDQFMVYERLMRNKLLDIPGLKRNIDRFCEYENLRNSSYFNDKVKDLLRKSYCEYKLERKNNQWVFREAIYCKAKIRDIVSERLEGTNPFINQKPFIRIENLYSSEGKSSIPLANFNETTDLFKQQCKKEFSSLLNIEGYYALKVSIKGNGKDSKDAICIRLCSPGSTDGYADYIIRTNFDGWREVILSDLDNAEYTDLRFKGRENQLYKTHRYPVNYSRISLLQVFPAGECKGVRIRTIDAVPLSTNALICPTVEVGLSSITFIDTLQSGEYIEYHVGEKSAIVYDIKGNGRNVTVTTKGQFIIPNGKFQAVVKGTPEKSNAPSEVVITFGLYGDYIKN